MGAIVCTLFEGHYHYGVAALSNSLYHHGYRGGIYAGYRGELPPWASAAKANPSVAWPGCQTLEAAEGVEIHFLPVNTSFHLAHYKPDFMLALMEGAGEGSDGVFYFDPDIVIKCRWGFYENWISHGVALVHEIVSQDMPPTHPSRGEWAKVISLYKSTVNRKLYSYLNCGFCGVANKDAEFLRVWSDIVQIAIKHYDQDPAQFASLDRTSTFWSIDQDAFNIAAMCCKSPISEIGAEGMDFAAAGWTMSHATGSPKPWKKNFFLGLLDGKPPTKPEKQFWLYANGLINAHGAGHIKLKKASLSATAFMGRFYRRY